MRGNKQLITFLLTSILMFPGCSGTTSAIKRAITPDRTLGSDPVLRKRFNEALALMRQKESDKAKHQLQALVEDYPHMSGPYINLGIIQLNQGEPAEAEASFTTALGLKPDSLAAHNQLGVALRMQGKFQQAEETYHKALTLDPDYLLAHRNLGILYELYLHKPELALQHYKRCQALDDTNNKEIDGWIFDLERRIKSSQ
jgi:tetratricopeptide (TPR) repeat protein